MDNFQVTKDARASFTRAAGIFIFYITHCANEFARENKRSTISAQDILNALRYGARVYIESVDPCGWTVGS
jgi:DNA polymerase epsilon subunit 3